MPEVIYNRVLVHMDEGETALYEKLKEEMVLEVFRGLKDDNSIQLIDAKNAAVLCGKLAQMASGAVYTDDHEVALIHDRKPLKIWSKVPMAIRC